MGIRSRSRVVFAGGALVVVFSAASCSAGAPTWPSDGRPTPSSPVAEGSTTTGLPAPPWHPSPQAIAVAESYVTTALSYSWTEPPSRWIDRVAPLCTTQWKRQLLSSADGGTGGWASVVSNREQASARVLAAYPSAGPGPGQRLEVTAIVVHARAGQQATASPAVMAVDVVAAPSGGWLIGWAG